jgi:hypothetical protein
MGPYFAAVSGVRMQATHASFIWVNALQPSTVASGPRQAW